LAQGYRPDAEEVPNEGKKFPELVVKRREEKPKKADQRGNTSVPSLAGFTKHVSPVG